MTRVEKIEMLREKLARHIPHALEGTPYTYDSAKQIISDGTFKVWLQDSNYGSYWGRINLNYFSAELKGKYRHYKIGALLTGKAFINTLTEHFEEMHRRARYDEERREKAQRRELAYTNILQPFAEAYAANVVRDLQDAAVPEIAVSFSKRAGMVEISLRDDDHQRYAEVVIGLAADGTSAAVVSACALQVRADSLGALRAKRRVQDAVLDVLAQHAPA